MVSLPITLTKSEGSILSKYSNIFCVHFAYRTVYLNLANLFYVDSMKSYIDVVFLSQ